MNRLTWTSAAVGCGFAAGMAIGPLSLLMANISDTLIRGWEWPAVDAKYLLTLLVSSLPAAVNGAVGAALASAWGIRGRLGVTVLPAGLHVAAALWAFIEDPRELLLLLQLFSLVFSVVIWPAGRLGQMIGGALRSRYAQQTNADPRAGGSELNTNNADGPAGAPVP